MGGVDIWDMAHRAVIERLQKEGLLAPDDDDSDNLFPVGRIHYATVPPERTDAGVSTAEQN